MGLKEAFLCIELVTAEKLSLAIFDSTGFGTFTCQIFRDYYGIYWGETRIHKNDYKRVKRSVCVPQNGYCYEVQSRSQCPVYRRWKVFH